MYIIGDIENLAGHFVKASHILSLRCEPPDDHLAYTFSLIVTDEHGVLIFGMDKYDARKDAYSYELYPTGYEYVRLIQTDDVKAALAGAGIGNDELSSFINNAVSNSRELFQRLDRLKETMSQLIEDEHQLCLELDNEVSNRMMSQEIQ